MFRRLIKDSRTVSESHYHIYKRYFGFLCYNALFVFIVTTSIMETVRACSIYRYLVHIMYVCVFGID